jgi:hypothetical protein
MKIENLTENTEYSIYVQADTITVDFVLFSHIA